MIVVKHVQIMWCRTHSRVRRLGGPDACGGVHERGVPECRDWPSQHVVVEDGEAAGPHRCDASHQVGAREWHSHEGEGGII